MTLHQFFEELLIEAKKLPSTEQNDILISNIQWCMGHVNSKHSMPSPNSSWATISRLMPGDVWLKYRGDKDLKDALKKWLYLA